MKNKEWVRGSLLQAVRSNLLYWSARLRAEPIPVGETGNLHAAVRYGLKFQGTQPAAAALLARSFAAAQAGRSRDWLPLYTAALAHKTAQNLRGRLLFQQAVLQWLSGESRLAAEGFAYGSRLASRNGQRTLLLRNLVGLCLCAPPGKASRAAEQLRTQLRLVKLRGALKAQVCAALGMSAFFSHEYQDAGNYLNLALESAPASFPLLRAQLHIAAGLSALAQGQPDPALKHYNAAGRELSRGRVDPAQLARLELLRAAAHYHKRARGQQLRLRPAIAALQRAAALQAETETGEESRALLESYIGRTYARAGDVQRGIRYLTSAWELSEGRGDRRMAADLFESLQRLENKNPA